jgi:altronate hydrolase
VALGPLAPGESVNAGGRAVVVRNPIPGGHKLALVSLAPGEEVIKYGFRIGLASVPVEAGAWIHSHNLRSALGGKEAYVYRPAEKIGPEGGAGPGAPPLPSFLGYHRGNGAVGTRNEIWILPTVGCVGPAALRLAALANERFRRDNLDGIHAFPHPFGCSQLGADLETTRKILAGLMRHPNAGGVLVIGLGCETNELDRLLSDTSGLDPSRVRSFNAQTVADEIETGLGLVAELVDALESDRRIETPVSELILGMKCGGSDGISGITANPLVGRVADWAAAANGTVLLSEVPEMFGAEQTLMDRAADETTFAAVVRLVNRFRLYYVSAGHPVHENPSPGNRAGGITTLEEKSLGAIQKGGSAASVTQVLDYGAPASSRGLVLVAAPGNDGVSSTALTAAGATLLLFTTGRGTPYGAPIPTLKISSTTALARRKPLWIDFDAGGLASPHPDGPPEAVAADLIRTLLDVASGRRRTNNEIHGYRDIAIWKTGVIL